MSNIIDLKNDTSIKNIESQVCVIGSGPAGGILAASLAKEKIDVILLESGGRLPDYNCESISNKDLFYSTGNFNFGWSQQLGGSSNLWAGRTAPLEEIDLEKRSWINNSGWPFDISTLRLYYNQASKLLGVPEYEILDSHNNTFHTALKDNFDIDKKCFLWARKPFLVSDYLKNTAKSYSNFRIFLNSPVTLLKEKSDGSSVKEVQSKKPNGKTFTIKAKYFVVAAGGIETPRLLLNSNQIRSYGIGNDYDVVGRYFSTHPKANIAAIILKNSVSINNAFFLDQPVKEGKFRCGIGLSKKIQKELKTLNHYMQLSPLMEYQANRLFEKFQSTELFSKDLINRNSIIQGLLPGLGKITYEAIGRIAKFQPKARKFLLRAFLDQYPDKENRVTLSQEKKNDGTYKADIKWSYSYKDKQSVLVFLSYLDSLLQNLDIGKVEYSLLKESNEWPLHNIHSHFMGATRMGTDKKTSVTDNNAMVHNSHNLYIAGPSLFPTYGFANPFLTITALSLKLKDHLTKQIT